MSEQEVRMIPETEARDQVRQAVRMMAALYYHMGNNIIGALGEEEGRKLIAKAVAEYGEERGAAHREAVLAATGRAEPFDYVNKGDLPRLGWDTAVPADQENPTHKLVLHCPLAAYWREKGFAETGAVYCGVDQAKYRAFHPDAELVHLRNLQWGDECCEMVCRVRKP